MDESRSQKTGRRRSSPVGLFLAGLLVVTSLGAIEDSRRVRWTWHAEPLARDWQPEPLAEDVVARALSRRRELGVSGQKAGAASPVFSWPLRQSSKHDDNGYWVTLGFVDHDERFPGFLVDYEGGERTYDIPSGYNHQGTDLVAWPFGWAKLALGQVEVVAAAAGRIVFRVDGNFDRECAAGFDEAREANLVAIEHEDGSVSIYGHLKKGSVTAKQEGERVERGEVLGLVGSSGFSGYPHLHFEVFGAAENLIDPFAGPFNSLNEDSWWSDQPPYFDTGLLTALTHSAEPFGGQCRREERTHVENRFAPGDAVHLVAYFRDLQRRQPMRFVIRDAEGDVFNKGRRKSGSPHLPLGALVGEFTLPEDAAAGTWTYVLEFEGDELTGSFEVGELEPLRGVRKVIPAKLRADSQRKLRIRGFGFTRGLVFDIQLRDGVEKQIEIRRAKVKSKRITLTVAVDAGAAPGPRDLVITAPDYTQIVVGGAFEVEE